MSRMVQMKRIEAGSDQIETEVNRWIRQHPDVEVKTVQMTDNPRYGAMIAVIWYYLPTGSPTKTTDLNEDEAWEAMKAGQIVTDGYREYRITHEPDGSWTKWDRRVGDVEWADNPKTDWRIVRDEQPTRADVAECIRDSWLIGAPETEIQAALNLMEVRWPHLFREPAHD